MEATDVRNVLFKKLVLSPSPLSMLAAQRASHRVVCRRRTIVGVALERQKEKREGVVLFTACPAEWIDLERVRGLVPDSGEVPIRVQMTGSIFAAAAAGDGISIPRCAIGSVGVLVEEKGTRARWMLSCNHVIADCNRAAIGRTTISDRGKHGVTLTPGTSLATLDKFHPIDFAAGRINYVDAALGQLAKGGSVVTGVAGRTITTAVAPPTTPMQVEKRGWATGLTQGTLSFFVTGFALTYATGATAIFDKQLGLMAKAGAGAFAQPGDSGALVTDTSHNALGLLFAVSACGTVAFANPIGDVLHATTKWNLKFA